MRRAEPSPWCPPPLREPGAGVPASARRTLAAPAVRVRRLARPIQSGVEGRSALRLVRVALSVGVEQLLPANIAEEPPAPHPLVRAPRLVLGDGRRIHHHEPTGPQVVR